METADLAVAGIPVADRPFLVDPLEGYPLVAAPSVAAEVRTDYAALARSGDSNAALTAAEMLLADDPGLHPAAVLAAEAELLSGDGKGAVDRLEPVVAELPSYTAAQLVLGRAAERIEAVPRAFRAYRAAAGASAIAAQRAEVLKPRAVEIVTRRIDDALRRGRADRAAAELEQLQRWAPDADATFDAARRVAVAEKDPKAELAALERLVPRFPERIDFAVRRAELELEVGDATAGLQMMRSLAALHPDDRSIQDALEAAKFRWRLQLLPSEVRDLAAKPELTRGELAVLVYWLIPQVRSTHQAAGRIAVDILEHPFREEIARVVNLELMEVDPTLHTFSPDQPVRRVDALEALLRADETFAPDAACLRTAPLGRQPTADAVCAASAVCQIVPEPADCLPGAMLSGSEALDLIRRAVELLSPQPATAP